MKDAARRPSRAIRILLVAGLAFAPSSVPAQEVAFDRIWSHDTGG